MSVEMKKLVIGNDEFEIVDAAARAGIGSPAMAATAAAMTDTSKIYVYVGSETGYTYGDWYYYNGSAWADGGVYNSAAIEIDDTLTTSGVAADAKAAGDAIDAVADALETKAEVDGAYESMTVGNAEQLISTVGIDESVPYNFRTSGGSIDIGNRETDKVIGGTVAWNQMVQNPTNLASLKALPQGTQIIKGHKYLASWDGRKTDESGNAPSVYLYGNVGGSNVFHPQILSISATQRIWNASESATADGNTSGNNSVWLYLDNYSNLTASYINLFDLTQMFGSTIADYIYTLEQNNAGTGVAWFRKLFPKDYYAYNAGQLMSVKTSAHNMVGFNAYDHSAETARLVGNQQYQITGTYTALSLDGETITPDSDGYFTPTQSGILTVTGGNASDTCVHLVWDGERDGEYEPYELHSYPLDSDLELRGIPKLDANNHLYYDGDTYEADGTVTRKYGIVDLGSLSWRYNYGNFKVFDSQGIASVVNGGNNIICAAYKKLPVTLSTSSINENDHFVRINKGANGTTETGNFGLGEIVIKDTTYTDATTFKSAMSGVYLVYELETPTTESAEPYTELQMVDDFGTEEYVDYAYSQGTRDVAIPVGHETHYMANLRAKLEMLPDSPDGDGDYIVRQSNGTNSFVLYSEVHELPSAPAEDGSYVLKCTISDGSASYSWEAEE